MKSKMELFALFAVKSVLTVVMRSKNTLRYDVIGLTYFLYPGEAYS